MQQYSAFAEELRRAAPAMAADSELYVMAVRHLREARMSLVDALHPFLQEVRADGGPLASLIPYDTTRDHARRYLARVRDDMMHDRPARTISEAHDDIGEPSVFDDAAQTRSESHAGAGASLEPGPPTERVNARENVAAPVLFSDDDDAHERVDSQGTAGEPSSAPEPPIEVLIARESVAAPASAPKRTLAELEAINRVLPRSYFDTIKLRDGEPIGDLPWGAIDRLIVANAREAKLLTLVRNYAEVAEPTRRIRDVVPLAEFERMVREVKETV